MRLVEAEYLGARTSVRVADDASLRFEEHCERRFDIYGFSPCGKGPFPVVIWIPGTVQPHDHAFIQIALKRIAAHGFMAVSLDYANLWPAQGCDRYRPRGYCMFDTGSPGSAINRICSGIEAADCNEGVAVIGHSQGGMIGILAANYHDGIRWVHAMGVTADAPVTDDEACVLPAERRLPRERLLVVTVECDGLFHGTGGTTCSAFSPGISRELARVTGMTCDSRYRCLSPADQTVPAYGWIKIRNSEVRDGKADHCYMFEDDCLGPPDPDFFQSRDSLFGLPEILRQLEKVFSRAARRSP